MIKVSSHALLITAAAYEFYFFNENQFMELQIDFETRLSFFRYSKINFYLN